MNLFKLYFVLIFSFFIFDTCQAAGSTVNEDFTMVESLCDEMKEMAKKNNKDSFVELADAALKLSEAQRRDNSASIDRFRPKLRAAKKAAKAGDFEKAITFLEEAKPFMKPATATWDGGF